MILFPGNPGRTRTLISIESLIFLLARVIIEKASPTFTGENEMEEEIEKVFRIIAAGSKNKRITLKGEGKRLQLYFSGQPLGRTLGIYVEEFKEDPGKGSQSLFWEIFNHIWLNKLLKSEAIQEVAGLLYSLSPGST